MYKIAYILVFALLFCPSTYCLGQQMVIKQKKSDALYAENQYVEAAMLYTHLYGISDQLNEQQAKNAFLAGKSYHRAGELDSAMRWYRKASDGFGKLKKREKYFIAEGQVADILDDKGDYNAAIEMTEKAVAYFKEQRDSVYASRTLNNLALYHYHTGNIQQSIRVYTKAILWAGETNNDLKAKCYNQLGNIWADDLKDEEKALEYYQKSLQLKIQSLAPAKSISFAYNNIGISQKNLGRLDSAMHYYQQALDFAVKSNEPATRLNPLIAVKKASDNRIV